MLPKNSETLNIARTDNSTDLSADVSHYLGMSVPSGGVLIVVEVRMVSLLSCFRLSPIFGMSNRVRKI